MCSRAVFRCFRWMERMGDKVTGAAGPVFVTLAVVLLSMGTFSFFDVIQPDLRWPLFTLPMDALIAINLLGHYYLACTVPPGFVDAPPQTEGLGLLWARRRHRHQSATTTDHDGVRWTENETLNITKAEITRCRKCGVHRPERAHHCRVCNRCVLKYDHHCPVGINQCVGIYNERHFVLFMAYLVLSAFCFVFLGYDKVWAALGFHYEYWGYTTPAVVFSLVYILAAVMFLAVGIMLSWHVWSICKAETSVESHDHEIYRKVAKERGQAAFQNSYDLGKWKNLALFFNLGRDGYPFYTLYLPVRVLPYTDGMSWARKPGLSHHTGIRPGDELTDDDFDDDDDYSLVDHGAES